MTAGVTLTTDSAHPACLIAKLTRSHRAVAASRATCNTPMTAAELAAPEGVLIVIAAAVADREGEVGAPRPPTLGSASAPWRSRHRPARPRSSRVGSRAMAMPAAKAIDCLQIVSKRGRGVAAGAQAGELGQPRRERVEAHTAVASQSMPLPGTDVYPRAVLLVAGVVDRLALVPVGKARTVTRHAAAPTLGGAKPRLVLVEPEPQAIRSRCAPVLLAQVHAAEERGGALGRHEEAAGAGGRGGPAGRAGGREGKEEEDSGGRQHASIDAHPSRSRTVALEKALCNRKRITGCRIGCSITKGTHDTRRTRHANHNPHAEQEMVRGERLFPLLKETLFDDRRRPTTSDRQGL
eukprot:scaffold15210_cov81-Phaeocystis_antarctica.AAC.4